MGDYIDKIAGRAKKGGGEKGPDAVVVVAEGEGYGKVKQRALDDLSSILGVDEKDREEFDGAMVDLISACMKDKKPAAAEPDTEEADAEE